MKKLEIFISRLKKLGIEIELVGNFPWVYLHKINGKTVTETYLAEHGFTLYFQSTDRFIDLSEIFKLIRKYRK